MAHARDIYGRRPVSRSRGKTQQRIMDLQHDPAQLPGGDELLRDAVPGTLAASIRGLHQGWVVDQVVTSRRAYERSLVLLARDFAENGPGLDAPPATLSAERLEAHLHWRVAMGLTHPAELQRAGVHLGRFAEWLDGSAGTALGQYKDRLRASAAALVAPSDTA